MPSQKDKIPWPGDGCIIRAAAYWNGLSKDKSGSDAIDYWAQDKSQEEIDAMVKHAGSLGFTTGFFGTFPLWSRFWASLFGNE